MKTRKFLAAILAAVTALSLVACGEKKNDESKQPDNTQQIEESAPVLNEDVESTPAPEEEEPSETKKPQPEATPGNKPQENAPQTDGNTSEQKPTPTPAPKPQEQPKTVGQTLLADFKAKAGATSSALSLAEKLVSNSVIPFSGASMPVEPGLLSGFGNTEIKGFKDGATFGPIIGSVPFIGYVFVLEDGTNASDFIATLKKNADLRWNICVEADEMVSGSVGNKVFFVMCPKEFSEE